MTTGQLYKHIETIYNHFEFKSKLIIDNLMIFKNGNHYQVHLFISDTNKLQFKISKQYSLLKKNYYTLHYEILDDKVSQSYEIKDILPKQITSILLPIIRQFNINLLFKEDDNTPIIFEHAI